ncbi:hypothetical protein ACSS6W_000513 [Trichoderma asperelloides]|uniref:alpha-glucosidase n=1 Tax=Trichoderma asperellum TaxID=101201 RepID=A0A6V8QPG8_TRIAP|nr:alpha-glucosidase precursor [Trichoderma asperelloides]GFP53068.1 glucoamylase 1 [Trichoderma asperellum]
MHISHLIATLTAVLKVATGDYLANVNDTTAVDSQSSCPGYKVTSIRSNSLGVEATLTLAGNACNSYGTDIEKLKLSVAYQDEHRLAVSIEPVEMVNSLPGQYDLPESILPKPSGNVKSGASNLQFVWGDEPSFWFQVRRRTTGDVLISTRGTKLVFQNQFIEFVTSLPANHNITGMGEQVAPLRHLPGYVATYWNVDPANPWYRNEYGSHPIYLDTRFYSPKHTEQAKGYTHGVFWRNAHGLESILGTQNLTWRAIGGSIDLYIMDGPKPTDVISQYLNHVAGLPAMQQYWTLGYHQSAWGMHDWGVVQNSIDEFAKNNIPLETMWVDIDYMHNNQDFSLDPDRFSPEQGKAILGRLHSNGQHFVPIIDAGIYYPPANDSENTPYSRGHERDVFIKNPDGSEYVGQHWPGPVVWADFHNPAATDWWAGEFSRLHEMLDFDGIWIDLNEPASQCDGSCGNPPANSTPGHEDSRDLDNPPYKIYNVKNGLGEGTMAMNATHSDGVVAYDVHNAFGHSILHATNIALSRLSPKRPFIIGRSTFAGSGQYAGHWGGDNFAAWDNMAVSIPMGIKMSIYGIPMYGVDTCGFFWDVSTELCGRWMQLSAFFPFYRNHYSSGSLPHEPWRWADVAQYSRDAIAIRYSLLPYMYTLFHHASTVGDTVLRALSWEFPDDPSVVAVDTQMMLGPAIMVLPVLTQGATSVSGVFPGKEPWYDWYERKAVPSEWQGSRATVSAPQGHIPVYIRGGSILPLQQPSNTTRDSRRNPWDVLVALDHHGEASGNLYLDDGESVDQPATKMVLLEARSRSLTIDVKGNFEAKDGVTPLASISIMGVPSLQAKPKFNGKVAKSYSYDSDKKMLNVFNLEQSTTGGAWQGAWTLTW